MTSTFVNKAVPPAGLLRPDDDTALAFQGRAWSNFCEYLKEIDAVDALPPDLGGMPSESTEALGRLRAGVAAFGVSKDLRALLRENPSALAAADAQDGVYLGLVRLVQTLHVDAQRVVAELSRIMTTLDAGPSSGSARTIDTLLKELAELAAAAMRRSAPIRSRVTELRPEMQAANAALVEAVADQVKTLQDLQVDVGRLQEDVGTQKQRRDELSIFTKRSTKDALIERLAETEASLHDTSGRAEKWRAVLAALEAMTAHGNWLDVALAGLLDFLENHRKTWAALSTGLTELAADASPEQLLDPNWMRVALGVTEAEQRWTAIEKAAKRFLDDA